MNQFRGWFVLGFNVPLILLMNYCIADDDQCDQIRQDFATLTKYSKSWAIF